MATDGCAILFGMSGELERLQSAARRWKLAERRREEVFALIVVASDAGVPQRDIVAATGLSREHVRRIVKKAHDEAEAAAAMADEA